MLKMENKVNKNDKKIQKIVLEDVKMKACKERVYGKHWERDIKGITKLK